MRLADQPKPIDSRMMLRMIGVHRLDAKGNTFLVGVYPVGQRGLINPETVRRFVEVAVKMNKVRAETQTPHTD